MQQRNAAHARIIDVSRYQGTIDWSKVAASGIVGAYAKSNEGATGRDSTFYANYMNMKKAGVARGAYCFAHPSTSSAVSEADTLIDMVLAAGGFDLDPMLDLEDAGGLSPSQLADFILAWENRVKVRAGRGIILYTYTSFIQEHLAPVLSRINHLRLWLADYGTTVPNVPGWTNWTILQYSETGSVPGISGHVDLDEFNGTAAELRRVLSTNGTSNTSTGGNTMTTEQVKQLQTNLRAVLKLPSSGPNEFAVDGILGPKTAAAIKSFQYLNKLQQTGTADSATIAALNKAVSALEAPKPTPAPVQKPTTPTTPTAPAVTVFPGKDLAKRDAAVQLIQQGLDILKSLN